MNCRVTVTYFLELENQKQNEFLLLVVMTSLCKIDDKLLKEATHLLASHLMVQNCYLLVTVMAAKAL